MHSYLILETEDVFKGIGFGKNSNAYGELVFNTAMTGYQEVITDPSYKGQIIVFTYPHIGNVGICNKDNESHQPLTKAIITRELPTNPSNWRSDKTIEYFLKTKNISGIANLDTRHLSTLIRDKGNLFGMLVKNDLKPKKAFEQLMLHKNRQSIEQKYCLKERHTSQRYKYKKDTYALDILVLDFGCKESILSVIEKCNHNISIHNVIGNKSFPIKKYDAVIISNGPGNPLEYNEELLHIKKLITKQIPILGICLGHQLLALALGGCIEILKFGHHGINHPVKQLHDNKVFITSQNHNYTVSKTNFPNDLKITHISLFDNSIQGFKHKNHIIYGFQGHPEGSPGPIDIQSTVFKEFFDEVTLKKLK